MRIDIHPTQTQCVNHSYNFAPHKPPPNKTCVLVFSEISIGWRTSASAAPMCVQTAANELLQLSNKVHKLLKFHVLRGEKERERV